MDLRFLFPLFLPLSPLYAALMRGRARCYQKGVFPSERLPIPVVSVGNLTLGGTGKTPMVKDITSFLKQRGFAPAIISRGYGGKAQDPVNVVSDGRKLLLSVQQAGDEPYFLASSLPGIPVLTGKKRSEVGRFAYDSFKVNCVVLDDGFQHLALKRDVDLVLFSAHTLFGNGRVFPGGDLREPYSALGRADAFIITGVDGSTLVAAQALISQLRGWFPDIPVFMSGYLPAAILDGQGQSIDLIMARRFPLFAFCGIANPASFRSSLVIMGLNVSGFLDYRDHHVYTRKDIIQVERLAQESEAYGLITTEKDIVKIKSVIGPGLPVWTLKMKVVLPEDFYRFLLNKLQGLMQK